MSEAKWLTTEDGKVRLPVLRPFTFVIPVDHKRVDGTQLLTGRERKFAVGEALLDPVHNAEDALILAHPWVCDHFADGHIERPERTRERVAEEERRTKAEEARREALRKEAEAALARAEAAAENAGTAGDALQNELDTPINQPRGRRSHKATVPADPVALQRELDTPISQLAKG
jgi:hypothetical protein